VFNHQSRLWVCRIISLLYLLLTSHNSFLDNVTTDIIHYESKKVNIHSCNSLTTNKPPKACVLSRQPFNLRRRTPGSQVILHPCGDFCQICIPSARVPDGSPQQYSRNLEIVKLHFHLSRKEHPQSIQRQLCALVVKVCILPRSRMVVL
jgi:hypothetical protein